MLLAIILAVIIIPPSQLVNVLFARPVQVLYQFLTAPTVTLLVPYSSPICVCSGLCGRLNCDLPDQSCSTHLSRKTMSISSPECDWINLMRHSNTATTGMFKFIVFAAANCVQPENFLWRIPHRTRTMKEEQQNLIILNWTRGFDYSIAHSIAN